MFTFLLTLRICTFPTSSLVVVFWKIIVSAGESCNISEIIRWKICQNLVSVISRRCLGSLRRAKVSSVDWTIKNTSFDLKVFKFNDNLNSPCRTSKLDVDSSERGDGDSDSELAKWTYNWNSIVISINVTDS